MLLALKPEGLEHDVATCGFCCLAADQEEPGPMEFTAEQETAIQARVSAAVEAAVAAARGPLETQIAELTAGQADAQVQEAVAAALEPVQAELETMRTQLTEAVVAREAAETALAELETFLTAEGERIANEAAAEARKDERVAAVAAVIELPEDFITANEDRWSTLDDEAFTAEVDNFKALAEKFGTKPKGGGGAPARRSALTAREEPKAPAASGTRTSAVRAAMEDRRRIKDLVG